MLIKKEKRIKRVNSKNCIAYEYLHKDKDINLALIEIRGRYPDNGFVMNNEVKELIFVVKGNGKIVIDDVEHELSEGDALLIPQKQKYYFDGSFELVISCHPAWNPEQHVNIA